MLVVDTSAVMAVLLDEPERRQIEQRMGDGSSCVMSSATFVELGLVAEGRGGRQASAIVLEFLDRCQVEIVPLDGAMARAAVAGWRRFGKGRHPAGLNLGDCFAYGLAAELGAPLLYVGDDFSQTDVVSALA